jgi:hypothetical protein
LQSKPRDIKACIKEMEDAIIRTLTWILNLRTKLPKLSLLWIQTH